MTRGSLTSSGDGGAASSTTAGRGTSPAARPASLVVLSAVFASATVAGWRLLWFLTDDAFIAFRYVSNHRLGFGWVWNPPPFAPVEGYSSFAWLAILDWTWALFGIEPPAAATFISLLCTLGSVVLTLVMASRLLQGTRLAPARVALVAAVGLGVALNLTFLTWSSSGLETALFNLLVLAWVAAWTRGDAAAPSALAQAAATAALGALVRPDGVLLAVVTALVGLGVALRSPGRSRRLAALTPLLAVPVHFLWRRRFYGAWLPNTYYAKVTGDSRAWYGGLRYLASFVLEYGLWFLLAVVALAAWRHRRSLAARGRPAWVVVPAATLLVHILFYVLVAGGDFFEYRILSHLVPLLFLALLGALVWLGASPARAIAVMALAVLLEVPIPWLHWSYAHRLEIRAGMVTRLAPRLAAAAPWVPTLAWRYVTTWDDLQAWLIGHYICVRRQEHKILVLDQFRLLSAPPVQPLSRRGDYLPVATMGAVGVPAWVYPKMAIIDELGLNDYVVARNPVLRRSGLLAHARQPPPGYLDCFGPGIRVHPVWVHEARIRFCESWYRTLLSHHQPLVAPPASLLSVDRPRSEAAAQPGRATATANASVPPGSR
jgi:arabinofuranosyltransferase